MPSPARVATLTLGSVTVIASLACGGDFANTVIAETIRTLEHGGSTEWDQQVQILITTAYDGNGSEDVDTQEELDSIPCPVFKAMDEAVQRADFSGVRRLYGFAEGADEYVGASIGFNESARAETDARMAACGLKADETAPEGADAGEALPEGTAAVAIGALSSKATSDAWDDSVKTILLAAYDANGSGALDEVAEVQAIDCAVWTLLDTQVRATEEVSSEGRPMAGPLRTLYGIAAEGGLRWVGGALGFDASVRSATSDAAEACGLGL